MDKYTYFWCLIIVAMTFFFIGTYKNFFLKVYYILWVNRKESDQNNTSAYSLFRQLLPDNQTIIKEAVIHERIKLRSNFLWIRHLLIFFGFMTIFFLDGIYTVVGHYFHHYFHYEFFMSGMGKAMLKIGMESGGVCLFAGLTLAIGHRFIYAETEQKYVDMRLLLLLWTVVLTGFLAEAFRLAAEPNDPLIAYSFIAGPIGSILSESQRPWDQVSDAMWVIHATITCIFFAYIPFSKFVHILAAPLGRTITQGGRIGQSKRDRIVEGLL